MKGARRAARRLAAIGLAVGVSGAAAAGNQAAPPPGADVRWPLDVSIGGTPLATLDVGEKRGAFLIDFGATASAVDAESYGLAAGTSVELASPLCGRFVFRVEDMSAYRGPAGGQRGRIGTDCLGRLAVAFSYGDRPSMTVRAGAPDPAALTGLVEVGRPGHGAPAVALAIGPVAVAAQLDSGFDDSDEPGILQGNAALLTALVAEGVAMHPEPAARVLGCEGVRSYPRWRIDSAGLAVVAADGTRATYPPPLIEIKDDVACGGIAAFRAPFAQIGASWFVRWRTTVIDGPGGRVWIAR